ncbi:hypothetical protein McpCs1_05440 [Methanocorpusculaceae archaeon Cs1]|uniref:Uncharacterized protein n=1 Tax=Methanorbis rubei TaxID=3028300 RepID=A0AAE4MFG3_9EURY|nr:hypothetical protein [Methanocorpusculaceae archaeon Cs1]
MQFSVKLRKIFVHSVVTPNETKDTKADESHPKDDNFLRLISYKPKNWQELS